MASILEVAGDTYAADHEMAMQSMRQYNDDVLRCVLTRSKIKVLLR